MEKYLIVTDTTSAMDQEIAQKNGIELISLSVIVDGHEYKDQIANFAVFWHIIIERVRKKAQ